MQRLESVLQRCLAAVILLFATGLLQAGQFEQRVFTDATGPHKFSVYVPAGPVPEAGWPSLVFLHGAGQRGSDGEAQLSNTMAVAIEEYTRHGREWPFVTIFPQCEDLQGQALLGWTANSPDGVRVMSILANVGRELHLDPQRYVLAGWSMGGYGAWSLACQQPYAWSRVLIISGGSIEPHLSTLSLSREKTPVWAIHGETDPLIPVDQTRTLVNAVNQAEGNARLTIVPGAGHDVWRRALADPRVLDWLKGGPLPATSEFDRELAKVPPLPLRSQYYLKHLSPGQRVTGAVSALVGNDQLAALSDLVRQQLLTDPRLEQGKLPDIQRSFGSGAAALSAQLRELSYVAIPGEIDVRGVSGGRLEVRVAFQKLALTIGESELTTGKDWARTGPVVIEFGRRRPAELVIEVQPVSTQQGVSLKLLQSEFRCDEGNWYIHPPTQIEVRSETYTAWHISTGLVGSLYLARKEIVEQITSVVPGLLERLDAQMQLVDAQPLALLLSPLPVMTPDVRLIPQKVSVSQQGLSANFDLLVLLPKTNGLTPLHNGHPQGERPAADALRANVAVGAITELSRLQIQQGLMQVNVLDISNENFKRLTSGARMRRVFPEGIPLEAQTLRTVLRLEHPLMLEPDASSAGAAGETAIRLSSADVALDFWNQSGIERTPLGSVHFSLMQPVRVIIPPSGAGDAPAEGRILWGETCEVRYLRTEALEGSAVPQVIVPEFETLFRDAWQSWARENGSRKISTTSSSADGAARVRLTRFQLQNGEMQLEFTVDPARAPKIGSGP